MPKRLAVTCAACGWTGARQVATAYALPCPKCQAELEAPTTKRRRKRSKAPAAKAPRRARGPKPKGGRKRAPRGTGTRGPIAEDAATVAARGGRVSKADLARDRKARRAAAALGRVPPAPAFLQAMPYAADAWHDLAELLGRAGLLTELDANVLTRYCTVWALWRKAVDAVEASGLTVQELDGEGKPKATRVNPAARQVKAYGDQLLTLERELGLTPATRQRLRFTAGGPLGGAPADGDQDEDQDEAAGADPYFAGG